METNKQNSQFETLTRKCECCEKELPYSCFDKHGKTKYKKVCKHCKELALSKNPIKTYSIPELLRELRDRGVKGKFTYTKTETIEL